MICRKCQYQYPDHKAMCPNCRAWQISDTPVNDADLECVLLEDVVSADEDRIETGEWDYCFGNSTNPDTGDPDVYGIVRGSANLIAGSPGAGKSTWFLQLSKAIIHRHSLPVLYLASEEQLPQIKARAVRLRIDGRRMLRFIDLRKGVADINAVLKKYQFGLLILDSLKGLSEDPEDQIAICKTIKEYASFVHAPAIISHHITKDEAIAGLMALQHEVDATMTFFPDTTEIIGGEPIRVLEVMKNRNGQAFRQCIFAMTKDGLTFLRTDQHNEEDEEEGDEE